MPAAVFATRLNVPGAIQAQHNDRDDAMKLFCAENDTCALSLNADGAQGGAAGGQSRFANTGLDWHR